MYKMLNKYKYERKVGDKTMKKFLSIIILSTLVFSAVGCGSSGSDAGEEENTEVTEETEEETETVEEEEAEDAEEAEVEDYDETVDIMKTSSESSSSGSISIDDELDEAIANVVLDYNDGVYLEGECSAEGHIVMDIDEDKVSVTVYTLTSYGEYSFQNNMFIKTSGTDVYPVVMTFTYDNDDGYTLQKYVKASDGSAYNQSIKELFPKELYNRIISTTESDRQSLEAQERAYAKAYLNSIGRTAEIGDYSDLEIELPDIPDDAYNMIFDRYWEYPYWLGTQEKIEDGVRYVYETQWKNYGNDDSLIYLTKYVYDTGEIIRTVNIHIDDGEVQSSEEKVLKVVGSSTN